MTGRAAAMLVLLCTAVVHARVIEVHPVPGRAVVAEAVARSRRGDTVLIGGGTHVEGGIVIDRRLTIIGRAGAVISGGGTTGIFFVRADSVRIMDLTLEHTGMSHVEDRAAIKASGVRGCRFERLVLRNTFFGIYLAKSHHCLVRACTLKAHARREASSANGIHSWHSDSLLIENNLVEGHRDGIYLEFTRASVVRGNMSRGNLRYGLHFMFSDDDVYVRNTFAQNGSGVAVMYSKRIDMHGNTFRDNWGSASYGLLLKDITDSRVTDNMLVSNTTGIHAEGGARLTVTGNVFRRNGWALRLMADCTDNTFSGNTFTGNSFDVTTNSTHSESFFTGNFWDAYRGYDIDHDGVGDVPYRPVRIFSYIVERNPPAIILMNSLFIALLDITERVFPSLTPAKLQDARPLMQAPQAHALPQAAHDADAQCAHVPRTRAGVHAPHRRFA